MDRRDDSDSTLKNITLIGVVVGFALVAVMFWEAVRGGKPDHRSQQCNTESGMCEAQR